MTERVLKVTLNLNVTLNTLGAGLGGSVGMRPTGDQKVAGSTSAGSVTFFRGD